MYCEKYRKQNLTLNLSAEDNIGISKNILMSMLSPLLENAVTASPDGKEIKIQVSQSDKMITIVLENECVNVPQIQDLKKGGFLQKRIIQELDLNSSSFPCPVERQRTSNIDKSLIKFIINIPAK